MATALKDVSVHLKDPSLLREQCYIDGEWVDADSGKTIDVTDPANGDVIGTIPNMGAAETKRAIDAAHTAFQSWKRTTAKERAAILRRWFDLMMENQEDLAVLMRTLCFPSGKPSALWVQVHPERAHSAAAPSHRHWLR